ncbi:lipase chaperone [Acidovorax sp. LjRoot74]|uniref:lipase secretion chaperone n=1 Tax=Acidovorax sp. LjRoot74 TaxID=3342337 RepID=UPI003ED14D49
MAIRTWAKPAAVLAIIASAAVAWWLTGPAGWPGVGAWPEGQWGAVTAPSHTPDPYSDSARGSDGAPSAHQRSGNTQEPTDPLLVDGLRNTLEALLLEAGDTSDPATLKQRLAALIGQHFPAALATRALALAERYVDYRVALGQLRAPQDLTDPRALRKAMDARHKVRAQFFDGAEYDALFAREAELDRYTLARLEVAYNTQLSPEQRSQALQQAERELSPERRTERSAATEHLAAAAQTAAFNNQNADAYTRHTARSAQYGEAAAHALARLDQEEQHWQQRLDQYSQARTQQGDGAALQQLRQQLFSSEEQQRVDAALALRKLQTAAPGS